MYLGDFKVHKSTGVTLSDVDRHLSAWLDAPLTQSEVDVIAQDAKLGTARVHRMIQEQKPGSSPPVDSVGMNLNHFPARRSNCIPENW